MSDKGDSGPQCCVIGCEMGAEFQIWGDEGDPDDVTEACEDHVGVLLGKPARSADRVPHPWSWSIWELDNLDEEEANG